MKKTLFFLSVVSFACCSCAGIYSSSNSSSIVSSEIISSSEISSQVLSSEISSSKKETSQSSSSISISSQVVSSEESSYSSINSSSSMVSSSFKSSQSSSLSSSSVVSSSSSKIASSSTKSEDGYYRDFDFSLLGKAMLGQTHDLITSTHTTYRSYDDSKTPSFVLKLDPSLTTSGQICEFYSQASWNPTWDGGKSGTWNREHVWPQSLSNNLWGTKGGGADVLHIRPTEPRLNSARNNNLYGEVANRDSYKKYAIDVKNNSYLGGYLSGGKFEPIDDVKGDVARIVLYVYTHYNTYSNVCGSTNGKGDSTYFGSLTFKKVISANTEQDCINLLKKWHENDPVSELEITRNNFAYTIQGNRNPFVDHPELVEAIW